jgi:hypothetical protein
MFTEERVKLVFYVAPAGVAIDGVGGGRRSGFSAKHRDELVNDVVPAHPALRLRGLPAEHRIELVCDIIPGHVVNPGIYTGARHRRGDLFRGPAESTRLRGRRRGRWCGCG